jgi:hypothetical protein
MKKIFLIALLSVFVMSLSAQKPDPNNWKHSGTNWFTKALNVMGISLTGTDITNFKNLVTKNNDTIELGSVAVLDGEIVNTTALLLEALGDTIKLAPALTDIGITSTTTLVSQTLYYQLCYYVKDSISISKLTYGLSAKGVYTAANYNGIGIYSITGSTFTRIAYTATNDNIWTITTATSAVVTLPATVTLPPGKYLVMILYCSSAQTTAPGIYGLAGGYQWNIMARLPNSLYFNGVSAAATYTSLPATIDASAFNTTSAGIFVTGN